MNIKVKLNKVKLNNYHGDGFCSRYGLEPLRNSLVLCLILLLPVSSSWAISDSRFALVIGNSDYEYALKLKNPANDSADIAKTLIGLHFNTVLLQDATKNQIRKAVVEFLANLKKNNGVGLFYYAGHGVQFDGNNYLIPVETKLGSERDIKNQSYNITSLLNGIAKVNSSTNIIILDACRDNPFKLSHVPGSRSSTTSTTSRSLARINIPKLDSGLTKLEAPSNTLIAFATAPGKVALDGLGRNSPYTAQLIQSMQRTGLTIGEMFRQVRSTVVKNSGGKQIPWESSSLIEDFYFKHRTFMPMGF